jgi:hypothetical protein
MMSLRNPPEGKEIGAVDGCGSFDAGRPAQKQCREQKLSRRRRVLLIFLALALCLISLQAYTSARSTKKPSQAAIKPIGALLGKHEVQGYAERFIKAHLDLPPSVRFADWSSGLAVKLLETGPHYYRLEING